MIRPDQRAETGGVNVGGGVGGDVVIGYTIAQHEAALARQEKRIRQRPEAGACRREGAVAAGTRRGPAAAADLEGSFETRLRELGEARRRSWRCRAGCRRRSSTRRWRRWTRVTPARPRRCSPKCRRWRRPASRGRRRRPLSAGSWRGRRALGGWAGHYGTAARLVPSYEYLFAARRLSWWSGDYQTALRYGEDLLQAAVAEHGEGSRDYGHRPQRACADARGRGPLRRGRAALSGGAGDRGEDVGKGASDLRDPARNLAGLLRAAGRYAEAEPLFRQALAIDERTLGTAHPDYAICLNNLCRCCCRPPAGTAEAEPLYREALAIREKTVGKAHPGLRNGAQQPRGAAPGTGRYAEAEPLYREALAIDEKTLGKAHPGYAIDLNNLAGLLKTRADTAKLSRSTGRRWRSRRRRSAKRIRATRPGLITLRDCCEPLVGMARPSRSTGRR